MLYDSDEIGELIKPWGEHVIMPSNEVKYDIVDFLQDMVAERDTTPLQYLQEIEDEEQEIEAMKEIEEEIDSMEDVEDEDATDIKVEKEPTPFTSVE